MIIQQLNKKYKDKIVETEQRLNELCEKSEKRDEALSVYAHTAISVVLNSIEFEKKWSEEFYENHSIEDLRAINSAQNRECLPENYGTSYSNPDYCCGIFGEDMGQVLSYLYQKVRLTIPYAYEQRQVSIMWIGDMLLDVCDALLGTDETTADDLKEIIQNHHLRDTKDKQRLQIYRNFHPEFKVYSQMICQDVYFDEKYLYKYGMYIGENERRLFQYFQQADEKKLQGMADTLTEAFIRGCERNEVNLKPKKTIQLVYHLGFEPVMLRALRNLKAYGLEPIVRYDLEGSLRPRLINTLANPQNFIDHRFDEGLVVSEAYYKKQMETWKDVFEEFKTIIKGYAGPALIETFGETSFEPVLKTSSIRLNDEQQRLKQKNTSDYQTLFNQYLPGSDYSFTINAYPLPSIGEEFEAILDETIVVNTLDETKYMNIQQTMIEALDLGEAVRVTGRNGNRTDLLIQLNPLKDRTKETNFNNCTADVNVPVGEIFTSPKLEGTQGKLHVKEVYLTGLMYKELEIDFVDGMMVDYTCKNYDDEAKNKEYIRTNLTDPYTFLPLGEFAIGTNTTAYAMARRFKIEKILPILIGEKAGPHFAIGDTCYSHSEDVPIKNPDQREVVSRENSISCLRHTEREKAYFSRHTDITVPYDELDTIVVITKERKEIPIILNGRFVLKGTEKLNGPLDETER